MIQQNPHKVKSLEEKQWLEEERTQQKLNKVFQKLPYSVRWSVVVPVCNVFSWTFTAYAFAIESFAIAFAIYIHYQSTISLITGVVLGLVLGGGIELIKRACNYNYWHGGIAEDDWSKGNAAGMVLMTLASVGLAFVGGLNLPEATTTPPPAIVAQLEDVEAIRADYDSQIAMQEQSIAEFDKAAPRWKGVMNKNDSKRLGEMKEALSNLMTAKNTAVQDAQHRNRQEEADAADTTKAENALYNEYKANTGFLFALVALVIELLIPLPFWGKEKYYFNCALERGMVTKNQNKQQIIVNQQQTSPHSTPQVNIIPNNNQQNVPPNQAPPTSPSPTTPVTRVVVTGFTSGAGGIQEEKQPENEASENASNPLYKAYKADEEPKKEVVTEEPQEKEQQPTAEPETIIIKNTYTHSKNGGEKTEMTLPQVQARVRQYQKSVDEAVGNIEAFSKAGDDMNVKFWKGLYPGRVRNLTYWQQAEAQLKKQLSLYETD